LESDKQSNTEVDSKESLLLSSLVEQYIEKIFRMIVEEKRILSKVNKWLILFTHGSAGAKATSAKALSSKVLFD
jgi:hypothetical protein